VLAIAGDTAPVEPVAITRPALPSLARHLAAHFAGRTDTTLGATVQAGVEAVAARETTWLGPDAHVAALVVRNCDRAVLAYLGGTCEGTMADMVRASRSPGSALKLLIYAMAFDHGFATPGTMFDDGPLRIGGYAPRDFDRAEHGPVTAAEALRQSLNRPAVRLLCGSVRTGLRVRSLLCGCGFVCHVAHRRRWPWAARESACMTWRRCMRI